LFCGDSVQGDGRVSTPQYLDPDVYLTSLARIARLRPDALFTCHLGAFRGAAIPQLLQASRDFVRRVDVLLREALRAAGDGLTLRELNTSVARALDLWDEANDTDFAFTVHGHLSRAVARGWARQSGPERPLRFLGA
jgi:hypothetical protein